MSQAIDATKRALAIIRQHRDMLAEEREPLERLDAELAAIQAELEAALLDFQNDGQEATP